MRRSVLFYARRILRVLLCVLGVLILGIVILFFVVSAPPEAELPPVNTVNDVTALNMIEVAGIYTPTRIDEIISLVTNHTGRISIGGARHSMGGQIGIEKSLHLDMRQFDRVISFSKEQRIITVQTGITWRKVQEYIDPHDLSVMIMQTYADFTVGGSLSVNVHGRYVGHGPIIHSVRSIKVVLADGSLVSASPHENSELFYACIGGYGGLGVIVEATLQLEQNEKVKRMSQTMPASSYYSYFFDTVRNDTTVVFHNADIYPQDYTRVRAVSYKKTDDSLTETEHLIPLNQDYRLERFAMWAVAEIPGGKWMRENWGDPIAYTQDKVCWRNYEASYNAVELEPTSRKKSTYVLQEYFVPVRNFDSFVPKMASIFRSHDVNVINVSIRHAKADTLSLLRWAPEEVFCFVVYYKQGTDETSKAEVGTWTRELVDAALSEDGSYYLPYQLHATPEQFHRAYPHAYTYFLLKDKLDPAHKFSNRLWEKYGVSK
jgi:FAD/FMN-containing dehydrogenase